MSVAHVYNLSMSVGGANKVLTTWTRTEELETNYDNDALAIGTDVAIGVALDISQIRSLVIVCDVAATIKTNSSGAPQETLTLVAGIPLVWEASAPGATIGDYFAGDITNMYVTNAALAHLQIYTCLTS
jgi:hypothetical protein